MRYKFVAIEGNIGAGKTTLARFIINSLYDLKNKFVTIKTDLWNTKKLLIIQFDFKVMIFKLLTYFCNFKYGWARIIKYHSN